VVKRRAFALAALAAIAASACAGGGSGQTTPQETARAYKEAVAGQNWERAFKYLTRNAEGALIGLAFITASYGAPVDLETIQSYQRFLEEHGIDTSDGDRRDSTLAALEDRAGFFSDMVDWIEASLPDTLGGNVFVQASEQMAAAEFTDFEVGDETAYAQMVTPESSRRVRFRKIDGRWFID